MPDFGPFPDTMYEILLIKCTFRARYFRLFFVTFVSRHNNGKQWGSSLIFMYIRNIRSGTARRLQPLLSVPRSSGMTALAITDHGNMYGVKEFHERGRKGGDQPILGCEVYVAGGMPLRQER